MKIFDRFDDFVTDIFDYVGIIITIICAIAFVISCFVLPPMLRDGTPTTTVVSGHSVVAPEPPADATNVSIAPSTVVDIGASTTYRSSRVDYYIVLENEDGTSNRVEITRSELGTIDIGDTWYDYSYVVSNPDYEAESNANFVGGFFWAALIGVLTAIPAMLLLFVLFMLWQLVYVIARAIYNRIY